MLSNLKSFGKRFGGRSESNTPSSQVASDPLDEPLLYFTEVDPFTIRDACEGVQIFGGIGSGKTSGSGQNLAYRFLKSGFGGIVLTAKPDETEQWINYAQKTGREDDLIIVNPENEFHFNFMEYEGDREGRGTGLTENLVELFSTLTEVGQRSNSGKGEEAFWRNEQRKLLRNAIDLISVLGGLVNLPTIYELVVSAPKSKEEAASDVWQKNSFSYDCLLQGMALSEKGEFSPLQENDFRLCLNYWINEYPGMADNTRSSVVSIFTGMADSFLRGVLYQLFCTDTTFKPEDTLEGKIIILDLPQKNFNELGVYAQIMFKYCWQRAIERRSIDSNSRPVFQWIDEAQFFVTEHDVSFQTTARSARSCNVYLTQNLPNYYYVLGGDERVKHLVDSLLGNLATKIFHNNTCATTNAWAAELFAKEWLTLTSSNMSYGQGNFSGGSSTSQVMEYSVPPRTFSGLLTGGPLQNFQVEAIIHQRGKLFQSTASNAMRTCFSQKVKS